MWKAIGENEISPNVAICEEGFHVIFIRFVILREEANVWLYAYSFDDKDKTVKLQKKATLAASFVKHLLPAASFVYFLSFP